MKPICNRVHVSVPATSANLGSGFDTVGLALDYHDELVFTLNEDPSDGVAHVIIHGEGEDTLPRDETHLVVSTFRRACATLGWVISVSRLKPRTIFRRRVAWALPQRPLSRALQRPPRSRRMAS